MSEMKFKSLTPEDVYKKLLEVSERLEAAHYCLEDIPLDKPRHEGGRHIIKDTQEALEEVYSDIVGVGYKEAPTDQGGQ